MNLNFCGLILSSISIRYRSEIYWAFFITESFYSNHIVFKHNSHLIRFNIIIMKFCIISNKIKYTLYFLNQLLLVNQLDFILILHCIYIPNPFHENYNPNLRHSLDLREELSSKVIKFFISRHQVFYLYHIFSLD